MIEINLLPKRYRKSEAGFKLGKLEMIGLAAAAVFVLAMVGLTWRQGEQLSALENDISEAQRRTAQLSEDIRVVDGLLDMKVKIAERMQAVERLDRHRGVWVRILEDATTRVPDFVWLSGFREVLPKKTNNAMQSPTATPGSAGSTNAQKNPGGNPADTASVRPMEFEGFSFTLNALASFMIKLMRSNYFDSLDLVYAKETLLDEKRAFNFKLSGTVSYLSDEELRNLLAAQEDAESKYLVDNPADTAVAVEATN